MAPTDDPGQAGLRSGEAAVFAGLTVRALRHYRRRGLVQPVQDASGYWRYPALQLANLVRIRTLRELGLGLEQIGELLAADATVVTFPDVLQTLREDLSRRAAALGAMAESVEQLLTGSGAASVMVPWRELRDARQEASEVPRPGIARWEGEQRRLTALFDRGDVRAALERLAPRLQALREAPAMSPEVDTLAAELAAALPAELLPSAAADSAMLIVLLGSRFLRLNCDASWPLDAPHTQAAQDPNERRDRA